jgi:N-acetylglucosaminyl-diphospho-decaprenol L-rhamnosyltransferase
MGTVDKSPDLPTTAVVTVSYHSDDVIEGLLKSVANADSSMPLVVVVDNAPGGSSSIRDISEKYAAHYIPQSANLGYGAAMNVGLQSLPESVDWVLLTNPDVVLHPGCIEALRSTISADPTIAAVGPAIETDGQTYPSARAVPSLRTGVGHALFANIWLDNPWSRAYRTSAELSTQRRDAGWLSGACLMVRRSVFEAIGGFDESFFMYFEDVDLGFRIGKAGYRNVYEPAAVVTHSGAHSTSQDSRQMITAHHQSARRFLAKKYAAWYLLPVRIGLNVGLAIRSRVAGGRLPG